MGFKICLECGYTEELKEGEIMEHPIWFCKICELKTLKQLKLKN